MFNTLDALFLGFGKFPYEIQQVSGDMYESFNTNKNTPVRKFLNEKQILQHIIFFHMAIKLNALLSELYKKLVKVLKLLIERFNI